MKKLVVAGMVLALAAGAGCAWTGKKKELVRQKSSAVRFTGYKITVEVKAAPEQVQDYLMDFKNLDVDCGRYKFKIFSQNKMRELGDMVEGKVEIAGIPIPGRIILAYNNPGREMWFIFDGKYGGKGILRYNFEKIENGTKVLMKYEVGDLDYFLGMVSEASGLNNAIAKIVEKVIARGQAYFDPSLKPEELLEKGIRGEFYDTFYQAYHSSIWINAPRKKAAQYLAAPENWPAYNQKYNFDLGQCMIAPSAKPCPVQLKLLGIDSEVNSFQSVYQFENEASAYWVSRQMISYVQILLKPERGGTKLAVNYLVEPPLATSAEGANLLINILKMPEYVKNILIDVKKSLEGLS